MKRLTLLIAVVCLAATLNSAERLTKSDLAKLDLVLDSVQYYDAMKYRRIDSIKSELQSSNVYTRRLALSMELGREYESFVADSSLLYYDNALEISILTKDSIQEKSVRIARFKALGVLGLYNEAIDELERLEEAGIDDALAVQFYDTARQLYYYLMGYAENSGKYAIEYQTKNRYYRDKLLTIIDQRSLLHKLYEAEVMQDQGRILTSRKMLLEIIGMVPENSSMYARVTSILASLASIEGDTDEAAHYWALSAASDARCSIKENVSLQYLAQYLYNNTTAIRRAYKYITVSMSDANFCNARLRNMQIAKSMPLINKAYQDQIDMHNLWILVALGLVSVLSVVLIGLIVTAWKQNKKLRDVRQSLKHANSVKDEFMGHFLDLCSIYMERLDNFNRLVMRKVTAGQIDDLMKMTKSAKFAEEQNKLFYENFDSAFLHIYPTFVEDVNALLIPSERIEVKEYGKLTMELRIFAFLRMGIDDSNKIASFLRFSVNTIYAYRNKLRNKAINRATFDKDIMSIGSINDE